MAELEDTAGFGILDIRSTKTKDLVRGLLARKGESNVVATFAHLMKTVSADDLPVVDYVLRTGPLFRHLRFRDEFPVEASPFTRNGELELMPRPELRPSYIVYRASKNAEKIAAALRGCGEFNKVTFADDEEQNFDVLKHISKFGHSLMIARKLAFIFGYTEKDTLSSKVSSDILTTYGLESNYGIMSIVDSIGFDFDYLSLKASFDDYASITEAANLSQRLSYLSFHPIQTTASDALQGLAAAYSVSLLDAVHYMLTHREVGLFPDLSFDQSIEESWQKTARVELNFETFFESDSIASDLKAFRAAPAFIENQQLRTYRLCTERLFDSAVKRRPHDARIDSSEDHFFGKALSIRDLLPVDSAKFDPVPTKFDAAQAGNLSRSCGVVKVTESNPDFSNLSRDEMAALMGQTADLDRLLSTSTLRASAATASDPFVKLLLQTLIRSQSSSTRDSFQFKQSFQNFVKDEHNSNVIDFLAATHSKSKEVVEYFILLLDETLLSQMPFLVDRAEDVYETRASILEWHAEVTGEESSRQKAKQLRIDRKIASVRGHINETRLNIDPLRFKQWIETSRLSEFSAFVRQDAPALPDTIATSDKKAMAELRLAAHRDPNLRAILAVMDCYREFCTNPDFGVASYLGRRIRHGTLRGTLLDGLPDPGEFDLSAPVLAQYKRWIRTFEDSTDTIASKLHFVGKGASSRAVISPEVDSKEKADLILVCLRRIFESSQADQGVLGIPVLIEQYCWLILEIELRTVQEAILESRQEFGAFSLKNGSSEFGDLSFEKAVNIALSTQFATVASWFRKPPNISPVAQVDDIINVVLREARAEYSGYIPKVKISHGEDLELSGLTYYHVYDALTIIVRNAAKHGAHPGALEVDARPEDWARGRVLHIEVATKVKAGDSAKRAVQRMNLAGEAGPENADVIEGFSGVRKLQKMRLERSILDFDAKVGGTADDFLVVSVTLPFSGVV